MDEEGGGPMRSCLEDDLYNDPKTDDIPGNILVVVVLVGIAILILCAIVILILTSDMNVTRGFGYG
jgi:hypothetical protein